MKKHEILYDWPITEINRLTDSDIAEGYFNDLAEPEQSRFVALTERIRFLGLELATARTDKIHFLKWDDLRSYVEEFGQQFASFPTPSVDKLRLSLLLIEKLSQSSPILDTIDINADMFELRELTQPLPHSWFCRENNLSIADSLVLFSCDDFSAVSNDIASSIVSPDLLFQFIAALHATNDLPPSQTILVKKTTPQVDSLAINAFARLVVLAAGKSVHSARKYTTVPKVLNPDEIKPGESYHQWSEVLNVLSEYNSRDETLLKFLTIYHVIENFMFKRPIVELERRMNGAMFSIRDFRRLYASVEMNEAEALKKLFQSVFMMQALPGTSFRDHLITRWNLLVPAVSKADINAALTTVGLDFSFNAFAGKGALSCFSKLVYAIRNTIVHNKETEFHLTYASLDMNPSLCNVIEDFVLPSLEEICFALIGKPSQEFWYQNKEISLYS
tara:strand:- start:5435 stop:6772 length:1338 start_codon:yes stop_codon:yes gene_type:complete